MQVELHAASAAQELASAEAQLAHGERSMQKQESAGKWVIGGGIAAAVAGAAMFGVSTMMRLR